MRIQKHFGFSIEQQAEVWLRWKRGESLSDIGRVLRKKSWICSLFNIISWWNWSSI
jgi:hypothetical protein